MVVLFDEGFQLLDHPDSVRRLRGREERANTADELRWNVCSTSSGGSRP